MDGITATELELLDCFGAEPHLLDPDVPWCYNDAAYAVELDGLSVSFAVQPAYRDVRLMVRRGDQRLFELNAVGVADVRVINERGMDAVEVLLSAQARVRVQLRPRLEIEVRAEPQAEN